MRQRRWFAGLIPWAVAVGALALVCVARSSRADDKSDLIRRIEDLLEDAGDALERLPGDSGDGPIGYADGYVRDARRAADDLARVAGDDASAKRLADDFDDIQDDWNEAAGYLRQLKGGARQFEQVARRCVDSEKELLEKARAFESRNDPDGLTEIPRLASTAQDTTKRALDDLYRHDDRMEDFAGDADDFRGDGPWRDLASTVAQVTRTMFEQWRRDYDQTKRTCENLARGIDHPTLKDILGKLSNSAGGRKAVIEQLNRDARDLASTLAGVSEDSSASSVNRAKGLLENIDRGVQTLARTPTTDKEARLIVEKWPEGIRQLREALDDLEDLKVHQHDMDPLPEKCQQKERELHDAIARNGSDTAGLQTIPAMADQIAQPINAGLAKARERMSEQRSDLARAKEISFSEGPWSDIRAAEQRDADETFATFETNFKKTEAACAALALGANAPEPKAAVENLSKTASGRSDLIKLIETKLDASAQLLNGSATKAGENELASALGLGGEMQVLLAQLRSTPGNDARAREVLAQWPGLVDQYKAAVTNLIAMKKLQFTTDKLPDECKRDGEALVTFMAQFKNPAGITKIDAQASQTKATIDARLQAHRATGEQLAKLLATPAAFQSSDGKWSYVSGYVRTSAQGMLDAWKAAMAKGDEACGDLAKGPANPKVLQVTNMLRGRVSKASEACSTDDDCARGHCYSKQNGDKVCVDCSVADIGDFRGQIKRYCKEEPRSCTSGLPQTPEVAEAYFKIRIETGDRCVSARDAENRRCWDGGDQGHKDAVKQAEIARKNCYDEIGTRRGDGRLYTCDDSTYSAEASKAERACSDYGRACESWSKDDTKAPCPDIERAMEMANQCVEAVERLDSDCLPRLSSMRESQFGKAKKSYDYCKEVLTYKKDKGLCK